MINLHLFGYTGIFLKVRLSVSSHLHEEQIAHFLIWQVTLTSSQYVPVYRTRGVKGLTGLVTGLIFRTLGWFVGG